MREIRRLIPSQRSLAILLTLLGCLQFAGYLLHSRALRGIGFSYGISPHPMVFGTVDGVEGFSTKHFLSYTIHSDEIVSIELDRDHFSEFRGSHFLKTVYSIFLAYPHMLKPDQVEAGAHYLLCEKCILEDFSIEDGIESISLTSYRTRLNSEFNTILNPDCQDAK